MQNSFPTGNGPRYTGGGGGDGPRPGVQFALPPITPVTKKLILVNGAIFLVTWLVFLVNADVQAAIYKGLKLDPQVWRAWFPWIPVWQLVTHGFLHLPSDLGHVFWNMVQLYFFGTMLESAVGSRRFFTTYMAAMIAGALVHLFVVTAVNTPVPVVGASGAVLGVVVAMATLRPHATVFLLIIPIRLWILAAVIVAFDFVPAITSVRYGGSDNVAHWVHLGGAAWGFATVKLGWIQTDWIERWRARRVVAGEQNRREDDHKMDVLLEKIHREGMSSLTRAERSFLKRVSSRK